MRKTTIFIVATLTAIFMSCGGEKSLKNVPFDHGEVKEGLYVNKYFDFTMAVPDIWDLSVEEGMQGMATRAENKDITDASKITTAHLFSGGVESHEYGVYNMWIIAERLETLKEKEPKGYINAVMKKVGDMGFSVEGMESDIEREKVGGVNFYTKTVALDLIISTMYQRVYVVERDGFMLNISMSYYSDKGLEALTEIVDSMVFN